MFRNHFKIALRNARKHSLYTLINILGLTVALTGALFLLLYVTDELSYDQHHRHADRIYRVVTDLQLDYTDRKLATSPSAIGPHLHENFTEVEHYAIFRRFYWEPFKMKKEDKYIEQTNVFMATPGIFEVFSYHFLQGDPASALTQPNSLVMTQSMAEKYFGNNPGNIIGKTITAENDSVYQVTGLIEDVTQNSHFQPTGFISHRNTERLLRWDNISVYTYIRVKPGFAPELFQGRLQAIAKEKIAPALLRDAREGGIQLSLQPLADIHFHSKRDFEIEANDGNMAYIYTFSLIAFFLILLAAINYINLATARGLQRAKEVGIRKTFGAVRFQLIGQFLAESFLLTFLAVLCSVLLLYLLSPLFNYFSGKNLNLHTFAQPVHLLWLTGLLFLLTLLSGGYPAFFLSRFRPVRALKGSITTYGQEHVAFRKMLVVVQFTISLVLIISTLVVYAQLHYWNEQNLGFDKEQVVKISLGGKDNHFIPLRNALLKHPDIKSIGTTSNPPGDNLGSGFFIVETDQGKQERAFQQIWVDNGFIPTLNIQFLEGRNFRDNIVYSNDLVREHAGVLVNEALVQLMGWATENAIGRIIKVGSWEEEVIGVVKDFHLSSLHNVIEPLVMSYEIEGDNVLIKIDGNDIRSTLDFIQSTWEEVAGTNEIAYTFLDQHFQQQYEADEKRGKLFAVFSGIIIFIACLGLFGLATFTAEQRTKEIGIRKVMGASIRNILFLLSKDYMQLLFISFVIAIPVANYFITDWLKDFAYKIPLQWWMFALPGIVVLLVALFSISSKTIGVARKNPVDSLRYE